MEIVVFGGLPYSMEHIKEWNEWIRLQKIVCIERSRAKAVKMPKIHQDKLTEFFEKLGSMGLLDGTDNQVGIVTSSINGLLSANNPT
jgi:hypothetical protein